MAKRSELDRIADTLDRFLALELWDKGVSQERIAKTLGRKKVWVNDLLKGIPKGGSSDGNEEEE